MSHHKNRHKYAATKETYRAFEKIAERKKAVRATMARINHEMDFLHSCIDKLLAIKSGAVSVNPQADKEAAR